MRKHRVLLVNDASNLKSGYGVYGHNVMRRLHASDLFELAELGQYVHDDDENFKSLPWRTYGNLFQRGNDEELKQYDSDPYNQFGYWKFPQVCLDFKPDVVLSIQDYWMNSYFDESTFRDFFSHLWMVACDGEPQNREWLDTYSRTDGLFTYSSWAYDYLKETCGDNLNLLGTTSPAADDCFVPVEDKEAFKTSLGFEGYKIIGFVSRNQRRKLFPDLFASFRKYLDKTGSKDTYLYCHTSFPDQGWCLPELLNEYGIANKTIFTYKCKSPEDGGCGESFPALFSDARTFCIKCGNPTASLCTVNNGVDPKALAGIYNLMDVYVQYSCAEGCGMSQLEAASCGVPVMSVDYSAMHSIVRELGGVPLKVKALYKELETGCHRAIPDNDYFVEQLVNFFDFSKEDQLAWGRETRENYLEHYNWDKTAEKWANAILQCPLRDNDWVSSKRDFRIPEYKDIPEHLNNQEFVEYLILNVLKNPKKLGSYLEHRMVRDLNYGGSTGGLFGHYTNENSQVFGRIQHSVFTREHAYQRLLRTANENFLRENERMASL